MNLPEITDVQRLTIKPGDRFVFRTPEKLTAETADHLRERLRAWLPDGVQILILDRGASVEVVEGP